MLIIGIAGGSGSGKSTITKYLSDKFGDNVTVLRHDDYYKEQHSMPFAERVKQNYDCPDAYDTELLAKHLRALRNGEPIDCPVYDYKEYDRSDKVSAYIRQSACCLTVFLYLLNRNFVNLWT